MQPDFFELIGGDDGGWKLLMREEYEVEKRHAKLGLTIYAYNDNGVIKAEVFYLHQNNRRQTSFCRRMATEGDADMGREVERRIGGKRGLGKRHSVICFGG